MDIDSWPLLIAFIFFVLFGAYFAGAESAYSAMNTIRIKSMAADGNRRAKSALSIANDFDRALTTLLIGNNITHIAASSLATILVMRIWRGAANSALYSTLITTGVVFLFSEMIPKSFANDRCDTMALACAGSLRFFMKLLSPIATFFMWITSLFTRLISKNETPTVTEEELHDLIDTIEEEGVLDEDESDLIQNALDFSGTVVSDIMTMKDDIVALDLNAPVGNVLKMLKNSTHSRLPVYEGSVDHIVGMLLVREYIKQYLKTGAASIRSMMKQPCYVSPDQPVDDVLNHMRQHRLYLAVVRDENHKTLGLVTIEDFLEELVGEIWDEDDVVDKDFVKLGGNHFQLSPRMKVAEAFERIGYTPKETKPFLQKPIISWVVETLRHIPKEEESFTYDNLEVTIDEVKDNTVVSVVIRLLDEDGSK